MAADLSTSLSFASGAYKTGDMVSGSFTVRNTGTSAVTPTFNVAVHLSTDKIYGNADDLTLVNVPVSTDIPAGISASINASAPMPNLVAPGTAYYVAVKIDSGNTVAESNENNNVTITDLAPIQILNSSGVLPILGTDAADTITISHTTSTVTVKINSSTTNYPT